MSLVSTNWLSENKNNVKILDSSWHLPSEERNSFLEFNLEHIPNSIYFDIDKNSDETSSLPHMLPRKEKWEEVMSSLGITNDDKIVIYDNSNLISSCRLWYTFLYFGHSKDLVNVLNGGLEKWKKDNFPTTKEYTTLFRSNYFASENKDMVKNLEDIKANINNRKFKLIDGRNKRRFEGSEAEPRKGLRSGSIKNSVCLPFNSVIKKNKTFKENNQLKKIFKGVIDNANKNNVVFSCGSGITSCVLALAYSLINNNYKPTIYDGSWSEYGKIIK